MRTGGRSGKGVALEQLRHEIAGGALPIFEQNELVGCLRNGHDEDENLSAAILMENLACKAWGSWPCATCSRLLGPGPRPLITL